MTDARSRTPEEYIRDTVRRWSSGRKLLVGVIGALVLLAVGVIFSAYAAGQGAAPVEGESFTHPPGTEVVIGNQYSGGKALKITSGQALPTKRVTITETSNVLVRARAGQTGGSPTLTIRVNGSNAGTRRITSSVLSDYLYPGVILQPGTYTIGLKGGDLAQGRYVFVDVVRFPAVTPPEGDPPVAVNDLATVDEDDNATTINVLNNDTDPDGGTKTIQSVTQPTNGTVAITNSGADLTYKPNADYCNGGSPTDDFTYTLNGGSTGTVSVTVTCTNDAPVAGDQSVTTDEDTPKDVTLETSDVDENDTLTYEIVATPEHGTLSGSGDTRTYTPDENYHGSDSFTFKANDGTDDSNVATVTITVTSVDDPPEAADDSATVGEDSDPTTIDVLANDTDVDDGTKTIESVTQPDNGTVEITNNGSDLTYTPDENYCNSGSPTDDFTYTLNGGSEAKVSVTVTCVEDDPVAVDDTKTVAEDDPATTIDVLANDTDSDGGTKTIESVTQPDNGTVEITNNGNDLTYTPDANYCNDAPGTNPDTFTYTLNGGSTANVDVTVTCVEDDPVAVNDSATKAEDSGATAIDVLANDTDPDGGSKTISSVTQPTNGTVVITNGGADLTYEPNANYCNENGQPDTFTYTLNGGSTATVAVSVTCVDDTPVAVDDSKTVAEDDPATTIDVLANDTDPDGGPKTIESVTQPANGTVEITNNGNDLTYTPDEDYCNDNAATDDFTYTLNGGSEAKVSVTVTCVEDAPVAVDDTKTVAEDDPATTIDVLNNDTDPDGGPKTIESVTQPANGTVEITNNGSDLTYKPNANYCNDGSPTDDFTYTLNGGSTATAAVSVTCVEDDPVAVDDSATKAEDSGATAIDVLANDTDMDGGSKSIDSVTQPTNGTVVITNGGSGLTYEPDADYCNDQPGTNPDTFTYTLSPGGSSATVSVKVTCVDDAPVAVNDSATVLEDAAATSVPVLTNDTDIDGGPKTISSASDPAKGTVVVTGSGSGLTYQPDPNYCNDPGDAPDDTFTYTLNGGSQGTVSMKVTCVNDAPTAGNETFNGAIYNTSFVVNDPSDAAPNVGGAKKSITGDVLSNDSDVETPGSISVVANTNITSTNGGKVAIEADGDFTYTSDPNDNCSPNSDSFNYTLTDNDPGGAQTAEGTVTINLSGCVWYVDNDPAETGNAGTSADPFDALSSADAKSVANQTVFVHKGTSTYTGGYSLVANERLIGEAVNLVVGGDTLFTGTPANRPSLSGTVNLNSGNTISGVAIAGSGAPAISGGSGDNSGTIADVTLSGGSGGLDLNTTSGTWNLSDLTINTTGGDAIRAATAGTVNFTGAGTISVTAAAGRGLNLSGTATSGVIDSTTVTSSANEGIRIDDDTGSLTLDDVNLTTTGTGLDIDSSNDVTVNSSGDADISSTGRAVSLTTVTSNPANMPDVTLDQVNSTGGATGINIDDIGAGTFSANGGTLSGHTGAELDVNNGSGNITYPGTIGNGSGLSVQITGRTGGTVALAGNINDTNDAGGGIDMSSNSGGTVTFSGATKTLNTGASPAFFSTGSNPTITFSGGGLDIDTTSGAGFSATGGGTVSVGTGANPNTIDSTTTGTALTVVNTTIGAGGATFQRISSGNNTPSNADDPANGIVLNNTGTSGGLTVTGNGAAGTGGTIQNTSSDSLLLTSTRNVNLSWMNVQNSRESGILGTGVTNLNLTSSSFTNNGDDSADVGIKVNNLLGTSAWSSLSVTGSELANVFIDNTSGTLNSLTVSGASHFDNLGTTFGGNSFLLEIRGTAVMESGSIDGATFVNNRPARGITVQAQDSGRIGNASTNAFTVQNSTFTNNGLHASFEQAHNANLTFKLLNNGTPAVPMTMPNVVSGSASAVNVFSSSLATGGTIQGRISGNHIGNQAVPGSGSPIGNGIRTFIQGKTDATLLYDGNTIRQTPQARGIDMQFVGQLGTEPSNVAVTHDITVTNNDVIPSDTTGFPASAIYVAADNQDTTAPQQTNTVRADIRGNTVPTGTAIDSLPTFLALDEVVPAAVCQLVGAGANPTAQLTATNTGSASAAAGCALIAGPITTPP